MSWKVLVAFIVTINSSLSESEWTIFDQRIISDDINVEHRGMFDNSDMIEGRYMTENGDVKEGRDVRAERVGHEDGKITSLLTYAQGYKPNILKPGQGQSNQQDTTQPTSPATDQATKPTTGQAAKPTTGQATKPTTGQATKPTTGSGYTDSWSHRPSHRPGYCSHKHRPGRRKKPHSNDKTYSEEDVIKILALFSKFRNKYY